MSKKIYLIRHSFAEPPNGKPDKERELTHEGLSTVRALGRHLINERFNPDLILCSTATRTRQTALNLTEELDISEQVIDYQDVIYNASVRELLTMINELSISVREVALIGHNPTVTYFGEYLSNSVIGNMAPASLVTIKIESKNWNEVSQGAGTLISYYYPNQ